MSANPYQTPAHVEHDTERNYVFHTVCFWVGVALTLIGFLSMAVGYAPPLVWLLGGLACFAIAGFHEKRRYRLAAIACFLLVLLTGAWFIGVHRSRIARQQELLQMEQLSKAAKQRAQTKLQSGQP